ncbi:ABC transporter permease [Streptomyces niger]|uniref:ABC transporter permease n=1 Tax=Streptomyces niger TaxID=66373 RepID=UPI0006993593|nr:FtsX-like permease family protein [Streptomyces niger]
MLRTALRSLRAHRRRFLLPALAVLLGVAFTSGSLLYTQSVRTALTQARTAAQPDASVTVRPDPAADDTGKATAPALDTRLLKRLRSLPDAAAARGTAEGIAFVVGPDGELIGPRQEAGGANFVPVRGGGDPRYPLTAGRGPRAAGEIALDEYTARRAGHRIGDDVRIVVRGRARTERLVGTVTAHDPRLVSGGTLTLFDTATAQRWFAPAPDAYTALTLTAHRGVSAQRLARAADAVLPDGLRAVTRQALNAEREAASGGDEDKLTGILLSFGAIALLVATFVVANTFTMLSAARAREHALLRAVGASRRYVLRLVLTEALLIGTLAAALGHLLGIGVATVLGRFFGATDGPGAPLQILAPAPLAAAFGVGIVVTLLAAYVPARRAAAVPPVAALRSGEPPTPASLRRRHLAGAVVTVLGAFLVAAASGAADLGAVTVAGAVLLLGLIILTPAVALGVTGLIRRPLTRLTGVIGTLAVENARRNPRRTAATAAMLMISLALISAVTVAAASLREVSAARAADAMVADLRVTPVDHAELDAGTAARIARLKDAAAVTPTVSAYLALPAGDYLDATAVDPDTVAKAAQLNVRAGSLSRLDRGIAVTREEARAHGWRLGSRITGTVEGTGQRIGLPVVALYDGPDALAPALLSRNALRLPADPSVQGPRTEAVLVKAAPGRTAALRDDIRETLDNPALLIQDRAEAGREAVRPFAPLLDIVYALLSLAVLIGSLGVVNTMAMAVFERVREIGTLRAIGFERGRVAAVLRLESLLISLLGAALGVLSGTAIGLAAVAGQEGAPFVLPWGRLALFFALAAAVGVLAATWPARQAARVPVLRAVQTDTE